MDVSVIIVNYNTCGLLTDCIKSIFNNSVGNYSFEVIVVDNASADDSRKTIRMRFPIVKWIQNNSNVGFGKANNIGASVALGRYLFFLNSDTLLLNDAIAELLNYADDHIDITGVIGGHLIDQYGNPALSAGNFLFPFHNRARIRDNGCVEVEYVTGADMFMSKKIFDMVGGFDPNFFMFCEEVDLQKRISESTGRRNFLIDAPRIVHLESGSFEEENKKKSNKKEHLPYLKYKMWKQSRAIYARKHFHGITLLQWNLEQLIVTPWIVLRQKWSVRQKLEAMFL